MITNCPYCSPTTAGEHQSNCPLNPNRIYQSQVAYAGTTIGEREEQIRKNERKFIELKPRGYVIKHMEIIRRLEYDFFGMLLAVVGEGISILLLSDFGVFATIGFIGCFLILGYFVISFLITMKRLIK